MSMFSGLVHTGHDRQDSHDFEVAMQHYQRLALATQAREQAVSPWAKGYWDKVFVNVARTARRSLARGAGMVPE